MTATPAARHPKVSSPFRMFLSPRSLVIGVLLLSTSSILPCRTAVAQGFDPHRRLYENREVFDRLSGAARTLLELRYGKKPKEKAAALKGDPSQSQRDPKAYVAPGASDPLPAFTGLAEPSSPISNTLVNNPAADTTAQDTQSETTIVLGAGSNVIVAFNDSGSFVGGASKFTGFSRSTDGGASFTDKGTLPTNASGDAGDPVLARDKGSGTIYLSTLFFSGSGIQMFRSFDNGASFTAPINAGPGFGGGDFLDKEWIAVDNFSGAGQGNVYLVFTNFAGGGSGSRPDGIYLTRSTNGGASWGPSGGTLISSSCGQGAFVTVGPDHAVYVFWWDCSTVPFRISMRKSTDLGVTFGSTMTVATLVGTGSNGDLGLNGGFRTNSFPQAAVNPVSGDLYVVYNDDATGVDRGNIYFRQSTDGGATWSVAVQLNTDSTSNDQWQPALAVTPDGSRLFVGWYDRRLDPANSLIDTFGVIGTISGSTVTFGPNFLITTQSFPVVIGQDPVIISDYMGDYDMAVADNSFFYYTWGDNRRSNAFHAHQPDVRFAKIPVGEPGPVLFFQSAALSGGDGNGVVDVNECNTLSVTLGNLGTSAATGVSGTLSFSTSGMTIAQPTSTYPDIPVGGTGTNATPFQISTSSSFTCGRNIALTLTATTAGGTFAIPFELAAGSGVGPATRFDNNSVTAIPDLTTIESPITVSGMTSAVGKVTVSFYITHTFDSDLSVSLVAPDGTAVELTTGNGGSGDNYGSACAPDSSRTTFDDAAATPITSGSPPFVGTFRPERPLSALNGKSGAAVNGVWKLRVSDNEQFDAGTLQCWSLFISPKTCTDGGGVCPLPSPIGTRLTNISTRGPALTGDSIMIGGFIIGGSTPKTVLVRGRGPSMGGAPFFVPGTLADPFLRLFSGQTVIAENNNWQDSPGCDSGFACGGAAEITATGLDPCQPNPGQAMPPPGCSQESAILITLPPGPYTVHLFGATGGTGVGLVEVFETDGATPKLLNISTRGPALTGDNIMIGGFIIEGSASKTVLLRGRGPSMGGAPFFVPGTLADPFLRLFSGSTVIATNNNWQDAPNCDGFVCGGATEISATGLDPCVPNPGQTAPPPGCSQESAILITLPPGPYTLHLFGATGGTGVGLVEVFEISE